MTGKRFFVQATMQCMILILKIGDLTFDSIYTLLCLTRTSSDLHLISSSTFGRSLLHQVHLRLVCLFVYLFCLFCLLFFFPFFNYPTDWLFMMLMSVWMLWLITMLLRRKMSSKRICYIYSKTPVPWNRSGS